MIFSSCTVAGVLVVVIVVPVAVAAVAIARLIHPSPGIVLLLKLDLNQPFWRKLSSLC